MVAMMVPTHKKRTALVSLFLADILSPTQSFLTAIRKDAGLCCGSRLRSGDVFAYVGLPQNLKDPREVCMVGMWGETTFNPF